MSEFMGLVKGSYEAKVNLLLNLQFELTVPASCGSSTDDDIPMIAQLS